MQWMDAVCICLPGWMDGCMGKRARERADLEEEAGEKEAKACAPQPQSGEKSRRLD